MKLIKLLSLLVLITTLCSSCAKIFTSPDAYSLAHSQKTIAIIPPKVSIPANKKVDAAYPSEQPHIVQ